jgi:predicted DNA-binding protein with PD1-like motif
MKYSLLILLSILFIQCKSKVKMPTQSLKVHAFRLKPGQDLRKEIESFVTKEKINAGYILTCVGSLTQTNIRYANQQAGTSLNGHFEIVSLTGTLSTNGNHLHISVSDSTGKTIGGHLLENNLVYTTAEIVVGESSNLLFTREKDGSTPWEELQIKNQ